MYYLSAAYSECGLQLVRAFHGTVSGLQRKGTSRRERARQKLYGRHDLAWRGIKHDFHHTLLENCLVYSLVSFWATYFFVVGGCSVHFRVVSSGGTLPTTCDD